MVNFVVSISFILLQQATESNRESHKNACQNKDFCNLVIPFEVGKILEFNQCHKSDKAPFIIYADLECLIE